MFDNSLKLIYAEILEGKSKLLYQNNNIFIKHFNNLDLSLIDIYREEQLNYAISKGVLTYKDRLESIINDNLWSAAKDKELDDVKSFLLNLRHSRTKYSLEKDKKIVDKEIKIYEERLFNLQIEKNKLIGKTAESFADKKVNEYYLFLSLFKDNKLTEKYFTNEDFNDLSEFELNQLLMAYNKRMELFNNISFKKISLWPNFINLLDLCADNAYQFFGRPIIELTFYQIQVFSSGKNYKNILNNSKIQPPIEVMNDSEKLYLWFEKNSNNEGLINNTTIEEGPDQKVITAVSSAVGASKSELAAQGFDTSSQDKISKALKESKTGELGLDELIKLGI